MLAIILCSHAGLSIGLKEAAELICGPLEHVDALSLTEEKSMDRLQDEIRNRYEYYHELGEDTLFLVDMEHATPYNACMAALADTNAIIISGMSLPMLLEIIMSRSNDKTGIPLYKEIIEKTIDSIKLEIPKEFFEN